MMFINTEPQGKQKNKFSGCAGVGCGAIISAIHENETGGS